MAKSYNPFNRWFYREDRVPHYQRMYLQNKNQRLWSRTPGARYYLYPFYVMFWGSFVATQYQMVRMLMGHKTWFGKD